MDFKVGQHIFDNCIKDLLGNKTRVLTSHQEQHMREADEVIVLYKGSVLGKGSFSELQKHDLLNTTIDRLHKKDLIDNEADESLTGETERESEVDDISGRVATPTKGYRGLKISQEDRPIGVVSLKLYWEYFKSGIHPLAIFALICFFLIAQGNLHSNL